MMADDGYGLLPTSVVGSYALPAWFEVGLTAVQEDRFGVTERRELYDDAVTIAIHDQRSAGVDVITDGEMRRTRFVQGFYSRMTGLQPVEPLRKLEPYGYDSAPRYRPLERITLPAGLGAIDEFRYLQANSGGSRIKATLPGPLTLSIHIQLRPGDPYRDRLELAWEFVSVINAELRGLVAAGADFVQLDEPSFAIVPGQVRAWVELFNACVQDVSAKTALHVCFGNLVAQPRGRREYGWMFPALLDARCDQFVLEFANRELKEIDLWAREGDERELAAGLVDVKSYYLETPEDVAERVRTALQFIRPEKLWVVPDCGMFPIPRWLAREKLRSMVRGVLMVRQELAGVPAGASSGGGR